MSADDVLQRIAAELASSVGWEEWVLITAAAFLEPCGENFDSFPP